MGKKKVLHLIKSLGRGGAETLLPSVMKGFNSAYTFTVIYFLPWKNAMVKELEDAGAEVLNIPASNSLQMLFKIPALIKEIRRGGFALIHCHLPWSGIIGRIAGKITKVPVIYTEHNLLERYNPITKYFNSKTLKWNTAVIAVSDEVHSSIVKRIKKLNLVSIHNGVDTNKFNPNRMEGETIRMKLGIAKEQILIGTVAVFRKQKMLSEWLRLASEIHSVNSNCRFIMIGDGPESEILKERSMELGIQDIVIFPGLQNDIKPYLSAIDIYMMTSKYEGLPIALLEAMSMEKPVSVTQAGGIGELVKTMENGMMAAIEDYQGVLNNTLSLVGDKELRRVLGEKARSTVIENFSIERMIRQTEKLYVQSIN